MTAKSKGTSQRRRPERGQKEESRPKSSTGLSNGLIVLLGVCCLFSVSINFLHGDTFVHHHPDMAIARAMKEFKSNSFKKRRQRKQIKKVEEEPEEEEEEEEVAEEEEDGRKVDTGEEGGEEEGREEEGEGEESGEGAGGEEDGGEEDGGEEDGGEEEVGGGEGGAEAAGGEAEEVDLEAPNTLPPSKLGGLKCDAFGGPAEEHAQDMVYWSDIPSDAKYVSPLRAKRGQRRKYMTFEPDGGGWNNIRMAMETIVGLSIAMGRTLVLPPEQRMYLLRKGVKTQRTEFSFAHFFPMHEMAEENAGLEIITMQEFLEAEAMTGHLIDKNSGLPSFPPGNRTDWNGQDVKVLKEWMRNVTYIEHMWKPGNCLAAFPASGDHKDVTALNKMQAQLVNEGLNSKKYLGHPVDVDGPPIERMHENIAGRKELCVYDEQMQEQLVVHFMCYHKMRMRYLVHFYAFLYFEDWRSDLWMKRFMRDHMRYADEIQCAAARVVHAVRERSKERGWEGHFDTFHIRRGDFQFKTTRISAEEIHKNSKDHLTANKTVFIATDERDKSFFDPIKKHYDVVFLDDYMDLLKDVNSNYFGMIDQLIASRGDTFFGCWFSTFTGFINRMRGYHSVKDKLPGYEDGTLPTTFYYATPQKKVEMHEYKPLSGGFFNREYPTSWRGIDKGIGEMDAVVE